MEKVLLFGGSSCYPLGGMLDFIKGFDDIGEAIEYIDISKVDLDNEWFHVYDVYEKAIIFEIGYKI